MHSFNQSSFLIKDLYKFFIFDNNKVWSELKVVLPSCSMDMSVDIAKTFLTCAMGILHSVGQSSNANDFYIKTI